MMWFSFFAYWSTFDTKPPKWALDFWYKTELGAQNSQNAVLGSVRGSMTRATPLACFSWLLLLTGTIVGHSASIGSAICLFFRWKYSSSPPNFWYKTCSKTKICSKTWKSSILEKFQKIRTRKITIFIFVFLNDYWTEIIFRRHFSHVLVELCPMIASLRRRAYTFRAHKPDKWRGLLIRSCKIEDFCSFGWFFADFAQFSNISEILVPQLAPFAF